MVKRNIKHNLIHFKFSSDTMAIKIETSSGPVVLAVNYTPPSRVFLPERDLGWIQNHSCPAYLMADLNAHHNSFDYWCNERGGDVV